MIVVLIDTNRSMAEPLGIPGHWRLVFDTEFDGSQLPPPWRQGWFGRGVTGPVNSAEDACYTPSNISFPGDGTMHLGVTRASSKCGGQPRLFTGALVSTNPDDDRGSGFSYRYGVLQARVYLPAEGARFADWPAVWAAAQSGPGYGEDDVIEGLDGYACWHFHTDASSVGGCKRGLKPGWHTVASLWRKGSISFYYDGKRVGVIRSHLTSPRMYLLLDNTATASGSTDSMRVQYVRVWQAA